MIEPLDASTARPAEGGASFPLRHRLFRLLWNIVWRSLGIWTPTPLHGWRRFLLRLFGASIDTSAKIYPGAQIWYPPNLIMRRLACLGPDAICYSMAKITLEPYALISQRAHLCAGTHNIDDPNFQLEARPIIVGTRAWIATEAFVGPGVSVGDGAVLGARAVTTKDLKPWGVYVGNPARHIRDRTNTSPRATST